jgi:hypothetical protein
MPPKDQLDVLIAFAGDLLQFLAVIIAVVALMLSTAVYRRTITVQHYGELDRMYMDLLRLAMEFPHLREMRARRTIEEQHQYDAYAYIVLNFVESVIDRCSNPQWRIAPSMFAAFRRKSIDRELSETWVSAINLELRLFRPWWEEVKDKDVFKPAFVAQVNQIYKDHGDARHLLGIASKKRLSAN